MSRWVMRHTILDEHCDGVFYVAAINGICFGRSVRCVIAMPYFQLQFMLFARSHIFRSHMHQYAAISRRCAVIIGNGVRN